MERTFYPGSEGEQTDNGIRIRGFGLANSLKQTGWDHIRPDFFTANGPVFGEPSKWPDSNSATGTMIGGRAATV
jgi:hypothetical protein